MVWLLTQLGEHVLVTALAVGNGTFRAVLDPLVGIAEAAAAVPPQRIERAVAEQTVKVVRVRRLVAGKIFT